MAKRQSLVDSVHVNLVTPIWAIGGTELAKANNVSCSDTTH